MSNLKSFKKTIITFTITGVLLVKPTIGQAELGDQLLRKGMRNEDIQELQKHLVDLNYLNLKQTTTYYGNMTTDAVIKFQRSNDLNPDGLFGRKSFKVLDNLVSINTNKSNILDSNRTLRQGMRGADVNALQERLKTLGFLKINNCTEYFGTQTRQAVMDLQRASGIQVDGIAGTNTFKALENGQSIEKPNIPDSNRTLRQGMRGADVNALQERLKTLGFLKINNCTEYFGTQTRQAVMDLQRASGIQVDGIAGTNTFKALENGQSIEKPNIPDSNRTLRQGMRGADVNALQERLKTLGFLNINNCTEYYGSQTKRAVMDFQRVHALQIDGIAGKNTFKILNSNTAKHKSESNIDDSIICNIIYTAKEYIGTPYLFGGSTPHAFDCSGYTQYVFRQNGITIPRDSIGQSKTGIKISKENLQTGDLIIFSGTYRPGPSHVGIYIGDGDFIHASSSAGVTISSLNSNYYKNHFSYGRRVL